MGLLALFGTSFVVALSGALMPGPLLMVTIDQSVRRGFTAGPLLVLGHAILELLLVVLLAAGLLTYITGPGAARVIAVLGGGFLIYMGIGMVRDALSGKVTLDLSGSNTNRPVDNSIYNLNPVVAGALVSLSNPYWTLWWLTVGLSYITLAFNHGTGGVAFFYTGHVMADLVWYALVAAAVAGGRRFMSDKAYRMVLAICGMVLLYLGGSFLYTGLIVGNVSL